jgi:hypothetical protein
VLANGRLELKTQKRCIIGWNREKVTEKALAIAIDVIKLLNIINQNLFWPCFHHRDAELDEDARKEIFVAFIGRLITVGGKYLKR